MYILSNQFFEFLPILLSVIVCASIIFFLIVYNGSLQLERRISKYSVDSIKDESLSFFDICYNAYGELRDKLTKVLKKSAILKKYSLKFNKYISYENEKNTCAMDYVSNKVFMSLFFILMVCFAKIIVPSSLTMFDILFFGIIGFFVIDVYFKITDYIKKRQVEQDLLNAIIIMNNAFRSGRSTMQAIEIVAKELKGPISQEFKKMHLEISYGLSLDVVFDRFSKRVDSDEVSYITSSLSILNKTGGNIIKVFSSIEKMLFNKRKLKQEMKSLTSSANMISKILLFMPFIFVIIITLLNNNYFKVLLTTKFGNIILVLIVIIYALYAFIVNRIMKVRFE